jgi:hypothetical protein
MVHHTNHERKTKKMANTNAPAVDLHAAAKKLREQGKAIQAQLKKVAEQAKAAKVPEKIEVAERWIRIYVARAERQEKKALAARANVKLLQERLHTLRASK